MRPDSWLLCSDSCEPWQRKMSAATAAKLGSWPTLKLPTSRADFSPLSRSSSQISLSQKGFIANISFAVFFSGASLISRGAINSQLCRRTDPTLRDNMISRPSAGVSYTNIRALLFPRRIDVMRGGICGRRSATEGRQKRFESLEGKWQGIWGRSVTFPGQTRRTFLTQKSHPPASQTPAAFCLERQNDAPDGEKSFFYLCPTLF